MPGEFEIEIFCCYAREDQRWMEHLRKHLKPLERSGSIKVWSDTDIKAGDNREMEVAKHLNAAHIILLLVSADFIASDYCDSKEMRRAMERHAQQEARVIPIILRPTHWKDTPFAGIEPLPKNAEPVTKWKSEDDALFTIVKGIKLVVQDLQARAQKHRAERLAICRNSVIVHMHARRYEEALDAIESTIQLTFDNLDSWLYTQKGIIMRNLKQKEAALAAHDRAIELAPDDAGVFHEKAVTLRVFKEYRAALEIYDQAIKKNPHSSWLHKEKALTLRNCGKYEEAIEFYDKALRREHPQDARTITDKAIVLRLNKQEEDAIAAHKQATQLAPNDTWVQLEYAITLRDFKRYPEAITVHNYTIRLEHENSRFYVEKGITLRNDCQYTESVSLFDEAIQRHPKDSWAYGEKGITLRDSKQYKKALEIFEIAIELNPNDAWLYTQKAITLRDFEDYE
jgi:tetratricopeptide (TPR) repeat protein